MMLKNSTDAMKDSRVLDYVNMVKLPSSSTSSFDKICFQHVQTDNTNSLFYSLYCAD